jgi:hypothetical protein
MVSFPTSLYVTNYRCILLPSSTGSEKGSQSQWEEIDLKEKERDKDKDKEKDGKEGKEKKKEGPAIMVRAASGGKMLSKKGGSVIGAVKRATTDSGDSKKSQQSSKSAFIDNDWNDRIDVPHTRVHLYKRGKTQISVLLKDGFAFDYTFPAEEEARAVCDRLESLAMPDHCLKVFAFLHRPPSYQYPPLYDAEMELRRVGFPNSSFVVDKTLNETYEFCPTYPRVLVVHAHATREMLDGVAKFRSRRRIPVATFCYKPNGACLFRSSQPLVAMNKRSKEDEFYLRLLRNDNQQNLVIFDSRPRTNAQANRLGGGGFESKKSYKCEIYFQDIENIHVVRNSLTTLRYVYANNESKEKIQAAESQWLRHIGTILSSSKDIVDHVVNRGNSVLVHCSDGWDRTAQSISLAEMIMDSFYRSLKGFAVLIEKEFCSFGHQFARRHGHGMNIQNPRDSQRSPIFIQFVHCVVQMLRQYPTSFEYNEELLLFILDHVHNCRFGNFLFDSERQRGKADIENNTVSIWSLVMDNWESFQNPLYCPTDDVLDISLLRVNLISMVTWHEYHKGVLSPHLFKTKLLDQYVE